jgi:hypothetical protein
MALKYEDAHEFVRKHGAVTAYTTSGRATPLRDGEQDVVAMVELHADIFEFGGKRYSRAQFEHLVAETRK